MKRTTEEGVAAAADLRKVVIKKFHLVEEGRDDVSSDLIEELMKIKGGVFTYDEDYATLDTMDVENEEGWVDTGQEVPAHKWPPRHPTVPFLAFQK